MHNIKSFFSEKFIELNEYSYVIKIYLLYEIRECDMPDIHLIQFYYHWSIRSRNDGNIILASIEMIEQMNHYILHS